ncbi:MAG TPA: DUF2461 domain-containing protein [Candidatus Flavonifractor merdigallinarum]|uniref:DUF2461 domain-containing protein n=1 Tax=Candidatus Flavonifractor merdigallinarum TaxID=2838589 RepID=A0A9D1YAB4_9FIRM|nr:DUF2461 domain-containing protein [Candidatus Flavonifractor merdigallinarum]
MFQGFTDATIDFMWGIRFNNDRTWFQAHKEDYLTSFYNPMKELSREVYDAFQAKHAVPGLCCKVSRIYRDARRLYGRGPYKDHLWWSMERPGEESFSARPVFWFELEPEGWSTGLGYYSATPATMAAFRARLDRDPKTFAALARRLEGQERFLLSGEDYKRPKGTPSLPLLEPWYNKRSFSLIHEEAHGPILRSHDLVNVLLEGFDFLLPFYEYFVTLDQDQIPGT